MKKVEGNLLVLFLGLILLFATACGESSPTGPGEKIVVSENLKIKGVPKAVIPYGEGLDITLSNLKFYNGNFTLKYKNRGEEDFTFIFYFKKEKSLVIIYLDTERRVIINSNGKVGFNLEGYNEKDVKNKSGQFKINIPSNIYGIYDLYGKNISCYIFAVKGSVNPSSVRPGNQKDPDSFLALSNVLTTEVSY